MNTCTKFHEDSFIINIIKFKFVSGLSIILVLFFTRNNQIYTNVKLPILSLNAKTLYFPLSNQSNTMCIQFVVFYYIYLKKKILKIGSIVAEILNIKDMSELGGMTDA